jgi:hypothetical protein
VVDFDMFMGLDSPPMRDCFSLPTYYVPPVVPVMSFAWLIIFLLTITSRFFPNWLRGLTNPSFCPVESNARPFFSLLTPAFFMFALMKFFDFAA